MTNAVQSDWIEVRDETGHLWCKYSPSRKVVQFYRNANSREGYQAEIPIDDLISGKYQPKVRRIPR